ncbi:aspartate--tRNA(Asn) ligase [Agrococcus terreus]|uniref:Aspartate--tRNA ligase n=1 Tax=Agrococcus terreus TaxID=574649 RepID=A0ABQ2KNF9_9MICO|nr:aspartate--tRNA(Asn) ligase [Agrococcus terreus]GGN88403.1 aspartate--tRNA(Asn) ligase [Agrococcus terreus]
MTHTQPRTLIKDLATLPDGPVTVQGWVETVRDQKRVQFVILRDESGSAQLVNPVNEDTAETAATISGLMHGSFVTVRGDLKADERVKLGGLEVKVGELVVETVAKDSPIADDSSIDKRLDWRFLDLRRPEAQLIFRVQTTIEHAFRQHWIDEGFIEIHTPKLMATASESRAELFEVPYFETTAYLAQSPQLFKQMAQSAGFGRIFEIAPAFRADPSFTSRHATEFTSVDAEISWVESHEDVMAMHEQLLAKAVTAVIERHGEEIQQRFGIELQAPTLPFPRIPHAEVKRIVEEGGHTIERADGDLDPEAERRISAHVKETQGHDFVFVTEYPSTVRPFYHLRPEGREEVTNSYDLIYNGVEISTGAQREHRIERLREQALEKGMDVAELEEYLGFFEYGVPPHGGFGMGLARVVMLMLGLSSIRETTFLFRGPTRLHP